MKDLSLRTILGLRLSDRVSNEELYAAARCSDIATMLRQHQLRWLGHVARMDDTRVTKQAMYSCAVPGGSRRPGGRATSLGEHYRKLAANIHPLVRRHAASRCTWFDFAADRNAWKLIVSPPQADASGGR